MIGAAAIASARFTDLKAISLDGSTQNVYVNNPSFKSETSGCISFWYKPTTLLTGTDTSHTIIGLGVSDAGNNSYLSIRQRVILFVHPTNNYISIIHRTTNGGATNQIAFSTTALTIGAWHHISIMSSGTSWSARVNDVSQAVTVIVGSNTGDWFGDVSGSDHRMTFGGAWIANAMNGTQYNACTLDETIYVNRTLTAPENTALYNAGAPRTVRGLGLGTALKSWWRMGDRGDTSSLILDRIGTNHLTTVGSPTFVTP